MIDVRSNHPRIAPADARPIERRVIAALGFARDWVQQVTVRLEPGGGGAHDAAVNCRVVARCGRFGYLTAEATGPEPAAALGRTVGNIRRELRRRLAAAGMSTADAGVDRVREPEPAD